MNEKALIKACQNGERQAFDELIEMYYPYVSGFLLKTVCDKPLAEDMTQETFLRMIRSIEKYDLGGGAGFGTWLVAIAKNCCIDYLRKNRVKLENIDDMQIPGEGDMASGVLQTMQYQEVLKVIETLPPEQGLAIRMKYVQDMTLAEISQQLGVPQKTIKSRIHEGTVKLRRLLEPLERDDDDVR